VPAAYSDIVDGGSGGEAVEQRLERKSELLLI
jgi:hypothetical protein